MICSFIETTTTLLVALTVFAGQFPSLQAAEDNSTAYFNGLSWISYDVSANDSYMATTNDMLSFRLKTNSGDGLIFYAGGNQGDYICLQLYQGKLHVTYDLGQIAWFDTTGNIIIEVLLNNNQWHDVTLTRSKKHVNVNVDGKQFSLKIKGPTTRLDLDIRLYLGGVPTFYQPGITVRKNYVGCIENFVWNGIHMTRDMDLTPRFSTYGVVDLQCPVKTLPLAMTFYNSSSVMSIVDGNLEANYLFVKLEFRTLNKNTTIIWKRFRDDGYFFLRVGHTGSIEFDLRASRNVYKITETAHSDYADGSYADGRWHKLQLQVIENQVTLIIDGKKFVTKRNLRFTMNKYMYIGEPGSPFREQNSFVGCIRGLKVQYEDPGGSEDKVCGTGSGTPRCLGVTMNVCTLNNRCFDKPCEHGSVCVPTYDSFTCICSGTGYTGATCHQPLHPNSCQQAYEAGGLVSGSESSVTIDIDGAGPLKPFPVQCYHNPAKGNIETTLLHDAMFEVKVDGKQAAGSYSRVINYNANITQIDQLVQRATSCKQQISYRCENSRLLETPGMIFGGDWSDDGTGPDFGRIYEAYGWWIGRNAQNNYYWGGSTPRSHKCACGLQGTCVEDEPRCNCDAGLLEQSIFDSGYLTYKDHLPVMELRFGDTGNYNDNKKGWHYLAPLVCIGDTFYQQSITFREEDSIIYFHPQNIKPKVWDISFRFKTTAENGVLVHRSGEEDFVEIKLINATRLSLTFSAGYGHQSVVVDTSPTKFNLNQWHTVYAERNRKETVLKVKNVPQSKLAHPVGVVYSPFNFNRPLVIGARTDFTQGFVGCMSSLQSGGEILDLYDKVENDPNFSYGVELGCVGKCDTNPCLNGGVCSELYSSFTCNCRDTPFTGRICGRDVGIPLYENQILVYHTISRFRLFENITIGFRTRLRAGIILQLTDDIRNPSDYMIIELISTGDLKIHFKSSTNRMEFFVRILRGIQFADGQVHIMKFWRAQRFAINVQVDDYEPILTQNLEFLFPGGVYEIPFRFNYMLFGGNTSGNHMSGCLFRAKLDTYLPIKMLHAQTSFDDVHVIPNSNRTPAVDCGIDEILPPAEPVEHRPEYDVSPPAPSVAPTVKTSKPFTQTSTTTSRYIYVNEATPLVYSCFVVYIPLLFYCLSF